MKKIVLGIFIVSLVFPLISMSQKSTSTVGAAFAKEDAAIIKEILAGSIFIIRQDYILKSTSVLKNKEYVKGKNPYYGRVYGFGVLSNKRLWTNSWLKTPWLVDKAFVDLGDQDTAKPILTTLSIKSPADKKFYKKEFTLPDTASAANDSTKPRLVMKLNKDIFFYEVVDSLRSLRTVRNTKDSFGILVIATVKEDAAKNDTLPYNISICKVNIHFSDSLNEAFIGKLPITENIIGGAFFKTIIIPGRLDISFAGILVNRNNSWYVSALNGMVQTPNKKGGKRNMPPGNFPAKGGQIRNNSNR